MFTYENIVTLHMGRTQIAARIDTPEYEAIQTIAEERDLSQSEVIRRLIQDGLTHRREQKKPDENTDESDDNTRVVVNQSLTPAGAAVMLALASGVSSFSVSANAFFSPGVVAFLGAMLGGFGALGVIVATKQQLR